MKTAGIRPDIFTAPFDCRTVAEIERMIVKRKRRRRVSQILRGKNLDKGAIAIWRLNLEKILHVFKVRSVAFIRPLPTFCFQTELTTSAPAIAADTRDTLDPATIASDAHSKELTSHEDAGSQNRAVSLPHAMAVTDQLLTTS